MVVGLRTIRSAVILLSCFSDILVTAQLQLNVADAGSIKQVAQTLAEACMVFYHGDDPGSSPGLLPQNAMGSYNWWQAGALWSEMVEYWYYTGDDRYNQRVSQAILFQTGADDNFEPANQTRTEGNDDQAFWAFAAMTAAESRFPNPPDGQPSWLGLAQAVFNRQAGRWDTEHCDGGLRWQFNAFNNGWMEKNAISNGCFFQLAARLARYTGNNTYAEWAERTYDWMASSPLISEAYEVFDSISFTEDSCATSPGPIQWTYNIGTMIAGCAFMYDYTKGDAKWETRLRGYLGHTKNIFFPDALGGGHIMVEYACEPGNMCNPDQRSFKTYLSRWLAIAAQLAPFTAATIIPWLQHSALAAVRACTANTSTAAPHAYGCGRTWYEQGDDGQRDVGNQMTALSIVQSNLITQAPALANLNTGSSVSSPGAGGGGAREVVLDMVFTRRITRGDRAAAWLLTVAILALVFSGAAALLHDGDEKDKRCYKTVTGHSYRPSGMNGLDKRCKDKRLSIPQIEVWGPEMDQEKGIVNVLGQS